MEFSTQGHHRYQYHQLGHSDGHGRLAFSSARPNGITAGFLCLRRRRGKSPLPTPPRAPPRPGLLTTSALGAFFGDALSASQVQTLVGSPSYNGYLGVLVQLTNGQRFFINSTESTASGNQAYPDYSITLTPINRPRR